MVFGIFDHAFYINCDHRTDRRQFFEAQAAIARIDVERVGVVPPASKGKFGTPGIRGCQESHLKIWQLARERGYGTVLILEDDASFTKEGLVALANYRDQIVRHPWDMLYFQVKKRRTQECENLPEGIHPVQASILSHAYAVRGTALDFVIDMGLRNDSMPLDLFLYEQVHPKLRVYGIGPTVAFQLHSASDVCPYPRPSFAPPGSTPLYRDRLSL